MTRSKALALRALIETAAISLSDEDALGGRELFPVWAAETLYVAGERVRFGGRLYKAVQTHTSQIGWEPPNVPALWTEVARPGEIPVWRQPTGAQDVYNTGDRVWYPERNTTMYESIIDNNSWAPDVYGWKVV